MENKKPRIFVSYSRVDKQNVEPMIAHLRRVYGYENVWYDDELHGGDVWWREILKRVAWCDIFLYMLSNESLASPYCRGEFEEAQRLQKLVVTVQIRGRTRIPRELSQIQYVNMENGVNDPDALVRLISSINYQADRIPAKKLRAKWTPETPCPEVPTPAEERQQQTQSKDITGTLPVFAPPPGSQPPKAQTRRDWQAWAIIIAAVIIVGGMIGAALVSGLLNGDNGDGEWTEVALSFTPTPTATIPTATATIPTATATIPTATPTLTVEEMALVVAERGVNSNTEWAPYVGIVGVTEREFDGVTMVLVPKGCFMMGTSPEQEAFVINELGGSADWVEDEQVDNDAHEQCVEAPFWIDKTEVTNGQYGSSGRWSGDDYPRDAVNWFDSKAHCEERGGRLPTEKEWEYAARGPNSLIYPWGNTFEEEYVVYSGNSESRTATVGSRPEGRSWVGALDMSGNVWEWVSSLYSPYPYDEADGREDINNNSNVRALRGGSWGDGNDGVRAAVRNWNDPAFVNGGVGFRCVRSY